MVSGNCAKEEDEDEGLEWENIEDLQSSVPAFFVLTSIACKYQDG